MPTFHTFAWGRILSIDENNNVKLFQPDLSDHYGDDGSYILFSDEIKEKVGGEDDRSIWYDGENDCVNHEVDSHYDNGNHSLFIGDGNNHDHMLYVVDGESMKDFEFSFQIGDSYTRIYDLGDKFVIENCGDVWSVVIVTL